VVDEFAVLGEERGDGVGIAAAPRLEVRLRTVVQINGHGRSLRSAGQQPCRIDRPCKKTAHGYDHEASEDAWRRVLAFFRTNLAPSRAD
jgi:dienelactone hydrolase